MKKLVLSDTISCSQRGSQDFTAHRQWLWWRENIKELKQKNGEKMVSEWDNSSQNMEMWTFGVVAVKDMRYESQLKI